MFQRIRSGLSYCQSTAYKLVESVKQRAKNAKIYGAVGVLKSQEMFLQGVVPITTLYNMYSSSWGAANDYVMKQNGSCNIDVSQFAMPLINCGPLGIPNKSQADIDLMDEGNRAVANAQWSSIGQQDWLGLYPWMAGACSFVGLVGGAAYGFALTPVNDAPKSLIPLPPVKQSKTSLAERLEKSKYTDPLPHDLMDDVTYELLENAMVLGCGHTLNRSTLEQLEKIAIEKKQEHCKCPSCKTKITSVASCYKLNNLSEEFMKMLEQKTQIEENVKIVMERDAALSAKDSKSATALQSVSVFKTMSSKYTTKNDATYGKENATSKNNPSV